MKVKSIIFSIFTFSILVNAQFYEPFLGTGTLNGTNGWVRHSGTENEIQMVLGSLVKPSAGSSSGNKIRLQAGKTEDVNKPIGADLTGVVYYSALIKVLNGDGLMEDSTSGDYFLHLTSTVGTSGITAFQGRLYIKLEPQKSGFKLGILNNSGGTATPTYIAGAYTFNMVHLVVVKYDLATNTATLWVEPTVGQGTEPQSQATNSTGTTKAPSAVKGFAIRQGVTGTFPDLIGQTGNIEIDEIRVGTTWSSVTGLLSNEEISFTPKYINQTVITDKLNLATDGNVTLNIFSLEGNLIKTISTSNNFVDLSELSKGTYFIVVSTATDTQKTKIIKL